MTFDTSEMIRKQSKNNWQTEYYENIEGEIIAKKCRGCENIVPIDNFHRNKKGLAGRESRCKRCVSRYEKKRFEINKQNSDWYKNHLKRAAVWRERNQECLQEYNKEYRLNNKERRQRNWREWSERNRSYLKRRDKLRREANPEYFRIRNQLRRARKCNLPYDFTQEQKQALLERFGRTCALTGDKDLGGGIHLDHVIPIASGHGGTTLGNMIPLRADLNISKSDHNIFDWFADNRERFGLEQRKFDELIEYLADINDMTTKEYEEYVRWCHDNPRTIDEINAEQEDDEATA